MTDKRTSSRRQSVRIAYCGMAAALSVALMLLGGVIPAATYAVPMLCGLLLLPVLLEFDAKAAWTTYIAASLIVLMLGFDKEAAFFYIFLGYYPIVKWKLDRIASRLCRTLAKAGLFLAALAAMYGLLALLFPLAAFMREFEEMGLLSAVFFVALYVFCMLLYDRLLLPMAMIYMNRVRPRLKFLNR
ncbi:MAG: hypothetical protein IJ157_04105 [Clostridia bacterium]|nr:hypothetical protein [Clostridia bacterium]